METRRYQRKKVSIKLFIYKVHFPIRKDGVIIYWRKILLVILQVGDIDQPVEHCTSWLLM